MEKLKVVRQVYKLPPIMRGVKALFDIKKHKAGEIEAYLLSIEPNEGIEDCDAYGEGTDSIWVMVLEGTLTINVEKESITLQSGDVASFPSSAAHSWYNPSHNMTYVLWICSTYSGYYEN